MPEDICDNFHALALMREAHVPSIVICMGEAGVLSRVLAAKVGGFGTYCRTSDGSTAPGQIALTTLRDAYRWASIDADTRLLGVIGWPVGHSLSPLIHNAALARGGLNAVYLPLSVRPEGPTLERFLDGCLDRAWLHASGFSVTVPHKTRVLKYLGDRVDDRARRIGAVNTVVVRDGDYVGTNTDYDGVLRAVADGIDGGADGLRGVPVVVLGAGGAARAVVAVMRDHDADVTICARSAVAADALAADFACRTLAWDRRHAAGSALLVNATSVGMWPETESSPMAAEAVARHETVFDLVYTPIQTRLLRDAAAAGRRVIPGVAMFVEQAIAQFRLWTGTGTDRTLVRSAVEQALSDAG
jgi:3-dehydroquinate dehydratase/shikimate dehydrogenase